MNKVTRCAVFIGQWLQVSLSYHRSVGKIEVAMSRVPDTKETNLACLKKVRFCVSFLLDGLALDLAFRNCLNCLKILYFASRPSSEICLESNSPGLNEVVCGCTPP